MEQKYIVLKLDDVNEHCDTKSQTQLVYISKMIREGRADEGKTPKNDYLVINKDEPYANEIIEILKRNGHWD